jgi:SAM-dependent methyltransferase
MEKSSVPSDAMRITPGTPVGDAAARRSDPAYRRSLSSSVRDWDAQVDRFARYFVAHANLPRRPFAFLDVGCGTGAGVARIGAVYPQAQLFGCDVEQTHVDIATALYGDCGTFFRRNLTELDGHYDVIECSNVLEHLTNWREAAAHLLTCCKRLYIFVPYRETLDGVPLAPTGRETVAEHVACFDKTSFRLWPRERVAIATRVLRTPGAWGIRLRRELVYRLKAALARQPFDVQRQLAVCITHRQYLPSLPTPFVPRPWAALRLAAGRATVHR